MPKPCLVNAILLRVYNLFHEFITYFSNAISNSILAYSLYLIIFFSFIFTLIILSKIHLYFIPIIIYYNFK